MPPVRVPDREDDTANGQNVAPDDPSAYLSQIPRFQRPHLREHLHALTRPQACRPITDIAIEFSFRTRGDVLEDCLVIVVNIGDLSMLDLKLFSGLECTHFESVAFPRALAKSFPSG